MKTALLIIDVQNDFCPNGALAVPGGDEIVFLINRLQERFDIVVASQDWHPQDHLSFAVNHPGREIGETIDLDGIDQILWPEHCVQDTSGADFHPLLDTTRFKAIVYKGQNPHLDSYSAFYDNGHVVSTELADYLSRQEIGCIYIVGLATDFCVKYSARDAARLGFRTYLIQDACRGIGDVDEAIEEMKRAGVHIISSATVLSQ